MKALIISHSYVDVNTHEQLEELGKRCELDVVTIKDYKDTLVDLGLKNIKPRFFKLHLNDLRILKEESSLYYFKNILKFVKKKYDILHIGMEPWVLGSFQLCLLNKIFSKNKIVFYTWENIFNNRKFPLNFFEWFVLRNSDGAICANEEAKAILLRKGFKGEIKVFPILGLHSRFKKKKVERDDKFTVGYVGRILKEKGLINLVEAIKDLDVRLIILGRGPFKLKLERRISELNIKDNIKFLGSVPPDKVVDYMNMMDVLVLPSLTTEKWKEQFGRVLVEAMACEVNIIGSSSAEIPNVIGDSGLIFKEGDSKDLKEKLEMLIKDKKLRNDLIERGKKGVEQFKAKSIAEKYFEFFKEVV